MKKALYGVMLTALLSSGCIILPENPFIIGGDRDIAPSHDLEWQAMRKHTPAVRSDQVTAENARDKAKELEDEVENDREAPLPK